jgi:hypothetical protein
VRENEPFAGFSNGEVFARGIIGETQLDGLRRKLANVQGNVLVYLHHSPLKCEGFGWFVALCDYKELDKVFTDYDVPVVAFGHTGDAVGNDNPSSAEGSVKWAVPIYKPDAGNTIYVNANASADTGRYNIIKFRNAYDAPKIAPAGHSPIIAPMTGVQIAIQDRNGQNIPYSEDNIKFYDSHNNLLDAEYDKDHAWFVVTPQNNYNLRVELSLLGHELQSKFVLTTPGQCAGLIMKLR